MLVLARRVGEVIEIGPGIRVVVTRIEKDQVGLGIVAPADVHIRRAELPRRPRMVREGLR